MSLARAAQLVPYPEYRRSRWLTIEEVIRHEVYVARIDGIGADERPSMPLGDYVIGSDSRRRSLRWKTLSLIKRCAPSLSS